MIYLAHLLHVPHSYAMANRQEWEIKGEQIIQGYLSKYSKSINTKKGMKDEKAN